MSNKARKPRHKTTIAIIGVGALLTAIAACVTSPSDDPTPPSGGQQFVLDYDVFATTIDSILTAKGCDNIACHGGGIRGTFELSPSTAKDIDFDYAQASLQVDAADPPSSPLLMKPLDELVGGSVHTASSSQSGFLTTADPDYQTILAWIQAGEYR